MAVSIHPKDGVDAFVLLKEIADGKWKGAIVSSDFRDRAIAIVEKAKAS